jgi:hypothetical protein
MYSKKKRELIGHPKAMIEEETSKTIIRFLIKSKRVSFIKR